MPEQSFHTASQKLFDKNLLLKGLYVIYKNETEEVKC